MPLVLASRSPRRAELLRQLGAEFEVDQADLPEEPRPGEAPADYVRRLALDKALAVHARRGGGPDLAVLGADTEVLLDGVIFGKPRDREHARDMLRRLSGRVHEVLSAVAWVRGERRALRLCTSRVRFRALADVELEAYLDSGEPFDKAGGYAIQGRAAAFIADLQGSYTGVMGLPLFETAELLREAL